MRLFAALGPGDIVAAHRTQIDRRPVLSVTSVIFSGQLLEYCREQNIETLAISHNTRVDSFHDGSLMLENRPRQFDGSGRVRYYLSRTLYALYLALRAHRFGADLAIIDSGTAHYFALAAFWLVRVPVTINFHNTLWPNGFRPNGLLSRFIASLNRFFFRHVAVGAIGCSPECGRQVQQLAGCELPFFEYRGQFRRNEICIKRMETERNPFRVVFAGRAERNKGVLDVAEIAKWLRQISSTQIRFDVCGDGEALAELRRIVAAEHLGDCVFIHGRLNCPELLQVYARAHAVIVPTRSDFCEGLPLVCAEAVLSGLPIITSRLSNAIPVLGPAIVEAEPENIESYVTAILKLAGDRIFYDQLANSCAQLGQQFLDRFQSYPAAVDRLIAHLFPGRKPLDDYLPLFERIG